MHKKQKILEICLERLEHNSVDEWALEVQARTHACIDFIAVKAIYHGKCQTRFEINIYTNSDTKGRKASSHHMDCFKEACSWLEGESQIHTITDFRDKV